MQSFILIGKDKQKVKEFANKMAADQKISKFDLFILQTEKQIGIADIKGLSRQMFLKPLKGDKKAVIIEAFLGITAEAQNAFLKILEEPPLSTAIIIEASSNFFLPTILSRCKVIEIEKGVNLEKKEEDEILKMIKDLKDSKIGDKLKLAETLSKDKETALNFLEKLIVVARNQMVTNEKEQKEYKKMIEVIQTYYKQIKQSNVNLRLALENLFLEL